LEGLGKIIVFAGTKEILVADTRKLNAMAKTNGLDLIYYEYPDMVHAWMFLSFPEALKAKQQIVDLIGSA
jgi:acetyl esterase/lipase